LPANHKLLSQALGYDHGGIGFLGTIFVGEVFLRAGKGRARIGRVGSHGSSVI
jgi:hypothetical protein